MRSAPSTPPAYAGIGSHETPAQVLALMHSLARALARERWRLRSGMSPGADRAFYDGALQAGGAIELYLPNPGFGSGARRPCEEQRAEVCELARPRAGAYALAARFHAGFGGLDAGSRALLARDCHQVLGAALREPAKLVLCWTPDGDLDGRGARAGGTGQALRVAHAHGIAVLNLRREEHAQLLQERLEDRLGELVCTLARAGGAAVE